MTNIRPKTPTTLYHGIYYSSAVNVWDYFNSSYHSLASVSKISTGSATWEAIVNTGAKNPGCLQFLMITVKNSGGSAKTFGARIWLDGAYIYTNNTLPVGAGAQTGICLAGKVLFTAVGRPAGLVMDQYFWDDILQLDVWVDDPSINVQVTSKLYYV